MIASLVLRYNSCFTPSCTLDQISSGEVDSLDENESVDIFNQLSNDICMNGNKVVELLNEKEFDECSLNIVPIGSLINMDKHSYVQVGYWDNPIEDGIRVSDTILNYNNHYLGYRSIDINIFDHSFIKVRKCSEKQGLENYYTIHFNEEPIDKHLIEPCLEIIKIQLIYLHAVCTHQRLFHLNEISNDKNYSIN